MSTPTEISAETVERFLIAELIDMGIEEVAIGPDVKFDAMDVDSLNLADLMVEVKKNFGVDIPRVELADVTVAQLALRIVELTAN